MEEQAPSPWQPGPAPAMRARLHGDGGLAAMTGGPTPFWGRFSPKTSAPHLRSPCRRLLHPLGDGAQRRAQPFPGGHARSPHPRPPSAAFRHTPSSRPPLSANRSAASRIPTNGSGRAGGRPGGAAMLGRSGRHGGWCKGHPKGGQKHPGAPQKHPRTPQRHPKARGQLGGAEGKGRAEWPCSGCLQCAPFPSLLSGLTCVVAQICERCARSEVTAGL